MAPSTRWLVGVAAVVAAAVTAALVAVRGGTEVADVPQGSPEAVVQDFLQAVADRDVDAVEASLGRDIRQRCTREELRSSMRHSPQRFRATLVGTEQVDGAREVEVRFSEHFGEPPLADPDFPPYPGDLAGPGWEHTEIFVVRKQGGEWRITDVPWPYLYCVEEPR